MIARLFKPLISNSFFIFGSRGTGKSSWIRENLKPVLTIDLLQFDNLSYLSSNPERLEDLIPQGVDKESDIDKKLIVIDEVQRIPELLNVVHRLIEEKKYRFVLTGSSSRKLRRDGVNLLAGRAITKQMHPFTAVELGDKFNLNNSLRCGLLPIVFSSPVPEETLKSYVGTYLREEVLQEGFVRNLGNFQRFLETAAFSQACIVNMSETARDCMMPVKTVQGYFELTEDLLLSQRITAFTKRAKRKVQVAPKFFFFDVGVFRSLRARGPLDIEEEIEGASFETLVYQNLRALNDYFDLGYTIHHWRSASGAEVDLILYGAKGLKAFEIKRTATPRLSDLSGLKLFKQDYPDAECFLIYGGDKEFMREFPHIPIQTLLMEWQKFIG